MDGDCVGPLDSPVVGLSVGLDDGLIDGDCVGCFDGDCVGDADADPPASYQLWSGSLEAEAGINTGEGFPPVPQAILM